METLRSGWRNKRAAIRADQMDRHGGDLAVRGLWLQPRRRADRSGRKPPPRAVKVWDKREFRNLDGDAEIGTRTIKLALRRLRRWAREGAVEELDLDGTIRATAHHGWLDVQTRPERRNAVKVLLLLDIGGSMDPHVKVMEELFTAAKAEFRHLEVFYFHNCVYEGLWRDNRRRWDAQKPTMGDDPHLWPGLAADPCRRCRHVPL
jgi:uncharacterized protein with von Willebrand factor type A (vWA) domain